MKILPAIIATILLVSISPVSFAQDSPETNDDPNMNYKETDWVTIAVPKSAGVGEQVLAKISIKGSAIEEDSELWVNLSNMTGTQRKHNVERIQPIQLTAGADATHEATFTVPGESSGVIFTLFTMPPGKTDWADKLLATEIAVKVE